MAPATDWPRLSAALPPKTVMCHCSTWNSTCTLTLAVCLQGAYLLAVLAENPCTHQCFKAEGCVELLLDLMHHGGPRAARAANAAVVSLAANADNHFGLVSLGLAPALVATLQAGKSLHTARGARYMLHEYFRLLFTTFDSCAGCQAAACSFTPLWNS